MRRERARVGELRPSQLLFSFGIGAIVDLPHISAMVMGLEDWAVAYADKISEERLLAAVRATIGNQVQDLRHPPLPPASNAPTRGLDSEVLIGVPVGVFPQWMRCPYCDLLAPVTEGVFEPRFDPYRPDRARFVHSTCRKPGAPPVVVPARFLVACRHGHLDDFPWRDFLHDGARECSGTIRLRKIGASDEAADLILECESCSAKKSMAQAFSEQGRDALPGCRGRRPHLRDLEEGCTERARPILLGASNSWFPIALNALTIPASSNRLAQLVEENWTTLRHVANSEILKAFRLAGNLKPFAPFTDDELMAAITQRRESPGVAEQEAQNLKTPEWRVLSAADPQANTRDFRLESRAAPAGFEPFLEQIVLATRLREVRALIGFTRIESPNDYADVGDIPEIARARISRRDPSWVPAAEVRGEGIFLQFRDKHLDRWLDDKAIRAREREFYAAHRGWRKARNIPDVDAGFPGMRYILLHSFAHALMRQLALYSGYGAASIRERIYASDGSGDEPAMSGVLLYTAAPDSEGTLGGLVALGEPDRLGRILRESIAAVRLCASDPLCAEHELIGDGVTLHGAACHACLFASETSCERGNKYLDRTLLAQTFSHAWPAFFSDIAK
jgi:MrfA Zn-binding domain